MPLFDHSRVADFLDGMGFVLGGTLGSGLGASVGAMVGMFFGAGLMGAAVGAASGAFMGCGMGALAGSQALNASLCGEVANATSARAVMPQLAPLSSATRAGQYPGQAARVAPIVAVVDEGTASPPSRRRAVLDQAAAAMELHVEELGTWAIRSLSTS